MREVIYSSNHSNNNPGSCECSSELRVLRAYSKRHDLEKHIRPSIRLRYAPQKPGDLIRVTKKHIVKSFLPQIAEVVNLVNECFVAASENKLGRQGPPPNSKVRVYYDTSVPSVRLNKPPSFVDGEAIFPNG